MANTPNLDLENINILNDSDNAYKQIITEIATKTNNNTTKIDLHNHDESYYTKENIDIELGKKIDNSSIGMVNGIAELDESGKIISSQLPSYVDDVLEYPTLLNFPATGESGKIYVTIDTNKTYRWSGTAYTEISQGVVLGETSSTAYRGDRGKGAYDHSQSAHAPSNAQKNSDITKGEIEAKLTDKVTTHYHDVTVNQITDFPTNLPANGGNADTVDGYHLNQDVTTNGSPVFNNVSIHSFENLKINGNLTNKVVAPDVNQIAQAPIAPFLWHDIFAFCKVATPTFETSTDGTTFTAGTLNKNLFSQKENQAVTVLNYTNTKAVRWNWYSMNFGWSQGQWLILGFTYIPTAPNKTVRFESSTDGITWTTRHVSIGSWNQQPAWFYINSFGGDEYLRLTITWNSGNGNINLSSVRLLTSRWGDQGQGSELSYPYTWDADMNITFPKDLTVSGNIDGNSSSATKLATARKITLAGDVSGNVNFDGDSDVSMEITVNDDSHNHSNYLPTLNGAVTDDLHIKKLANDKVASLVTEVNGQLLDFGTNYTQSGKRRTAEHGALFRIDVRDGSPLFNVIFQDASGTPETTPFSVDRDGVVNIPAGKDFKIGGVGVNARINELFQSASNGKTLIASAITGKNIPTSPTDTYQKMTDNINMLSALDIPVGTPLSSCTWGQINTISNLGIASGYFSIGDTKDIVVNGETITMQIYGFNHDNKTDGTGKAGITFGMKNSMTTTRQINPTDTNIGGWTSSAMRSWITGTLLGQLPSDLLAVIKPVNKLSSAGKKSATISTTSDKVFLFSEIECLGTATYSFSGEGSKYPIFTNDASRVKKLANGTGGFKHWYTRSPSKNWPYGFCEFNVLGATDNVTYASIDGGVVFGFCV